MVVARGCKGVKWGRLVFNGDRVSVLQDEKRVLRTCYITTFVYSTLLNCTLKMMKTV